MKKLILFFTSFAVLFISQTTQAHQSLVTRAQNGQELFNFYAADENEIYCNAERSVSTLTREHLNAFQYASDYWASLLGDLPKNSKAAKISVGVSTNYSASAESKFDAGNGYKKTHLASAILHGSTQDFKEDFFSVIELGYKQRYVISDPTYGSYAEPIKLLPNHGNSSLSSILVHEIGHTMGIKLSTLHTFFYGPTNPIAVAHLVDSFGTRVSPYSRMDIVQGNAAIRDKFVIISTGTASLDDPSIGGYAFFQGKNVNAVINPTNSPDVYFSFNNPHRTQGIPINGFEVSPPKIDISHIELRNSMMSHQKYRNWTTFMEAELALLQDIGIPLDSKNFYGYSIYTDGGVHVLSSIHSFYARTKDSSGNWIYSPGQFNKTPLTIGLHVYGSSNTISMSQEILTEGRASAGIRIEGVNNRLTINKESNICANGEDGIGILVSYGKNHNITHNGTITATGKDGIGIRCDFGHNLLGDFCEYRGSFIRNNTCIEVEDLPLLDELNGPLVEDLVISGNIKANYAAIYISENAFVKNIRICNGAQIEGDIISVREGTNIVEDTDTRKWSPINMNRSIQYPNKDELNTKLIFGNSPDSEITYRGNITAKGAMDVIISEGRLNYHGKMRGLRHFYVEPIATFSLNAHLNDHTSVEAQEVKFKYGSNVIVDCDLSFIYSPTILELISENIDDPSAIFCTYVGNNEITIGFYDCVCPSVKWTQSAKGLNLNLTCNTKLVSRELTAIEAVGAPLIMAAYDKSAEAIFDRAKLTSRKKEIDAWCSPDMAFSAQSKTDSKYNVNSKSAVFGVDNKIADNLLLGIGCEVAYPKYTSNDANIDVEHLSAFMYGATNLLEEVSLSFFIKGGKNFYLQNRRVREEKYRSDYEGSQYNLGLKIDRSLKAWKEIEVKPFTSYECIILDIDSYVEGKEKYALKFDKSITKTHRINIGTEFNYNVTKTIDLGTSVFYSGICDDINANTLVKYVQAEAVSEVSHGEELERHSINASVNFTVKPTGYTSISLGYGVTTGKNCANNQFDANFSLRF